MAAEKKINIETIKGSGKNGLVLKEDVMSLMGIKPAPSERKIAHGPEERIKMTRLRLTIAKRLKEAQENAAMLTTFNEVDMSEVIAMRNQYKDEFQKKYSKPINIFRLSGIYSKESNIVKRIKFGSRLVIRKKNHFFSTLPTMPFMPQHKHPRKISNRCKKNFLTSIRNGRS